MIQPIGQEIKNSRTADGRIKMIFIKLDWHEGRGNHSGRTFTEFSEIDKVLKLIAADVGSPSSGYCKCGFTLTFADGMEYTGRFDVHGLDQKQETSTGAICLADHINDHLGYCSGSRQPSHMSCERYEMHIAGLQRRQPGFPEQCSQILETYQLDDE